MLISFEFVVSYWEKYSFLQIWAGILIIVDIEKKNDKKKIVDKKKKPYGWQKKKCMKDAAYILYLYS